MDISHHIHSACSYLFMYISFYSLHTIWFTHFWKGLYQEQEIVFDYVIQFNSNPMTYAVKFGVVMKRVVVDQNELN